MKVDKITLVFTLALMAIFSLFYYPKWNKSGTEATLSWDSSGYYWYLPAIFIYKDIKKLGFSEAIIKKYNPSPDFQQAYEHPSGNYVLKYSSGQALVMSPGFFIGDFAAKILEFPRDGFSLPYQFSIFLWGLMICLFGIYLLYLVLKRYFNPIVVSITLLIIVFGTNYLEYGGITNTMTHNYLFTFYAALLFVTDKFYVAPSWKWALCIGAILGLMTLTRPTEIIALIIPVLYGISMNFSSIKERFHFIRSHWKHYFLASILFVCIGSIQMFYWKYVTNEWFVYSYEDQGFSWLHPHLYEGLLSARAGWWVYSPLMFLIVPGFVILFYKKPSLAPSFGLFSLLFIYITFAWDIWWYGGSVGQRALVQIYPILSFPIAAFVSLYKGLNFWTLISTFLLLMGINYNFWVIHQAHKGGMLYAGFMTKPYLKAILLKKEMPEGALKLLDTKYNHTSPLKQTTLMISKDSSIQECVSKDQQFSIPHKVNLRGKVGWLRIQAKFRMGEKEWDTWKMTQLVVKYSKDGNEIYSDILRIQRHFDGGEQVLYLDSKIREGADTVEIFLWNSEGNKELCMSEFEVFNYSEW